MPMTGMTKSNPAASYRQSNRQWNPPLSAQPVPAVHIGGFARTLLKGSPEGDERRSYLESMVRETRQLEEVLSEVLELEESKAPW